MSVSNLVSNPRVLAGLKEQMAESEDAFNQRATLLATAAGYELADVVKEFNAIIVQERRASLEAEILTQAKGYTVPASIIELFNRGSEMAEQFSTEDSKVNFNLSIESTSDGSLRLVPRFSGKRGRATTTGGGNIDGFTAFERGVKKGDSFVIERRGRGDFYDVTRNEDVPKRGLIKWILTHYPDSESANILKAAGKTL